MVTIFKNKGFSELLYPHYISVDTALERIKTGASIALNTRIRNGEEHLKDELPAVVFGGECRKKVKRTSQKGEEYETFRTDESITVHSGFFVLDFDKVDVEAKRSQLLADPYMYAVWISPRAKGLKALVKCEPSLEKHDDMYTAFIERYPELDTTSRNISRLCYESYDPNIYINPLSLVWDKCIKKEEIQALKSKVSKRRGRHLLAKAAMIVRSSIDTEKHDDLLRASNLLGGYVASGRVEKDVAIALLETEILAKNPKDFERAKKTIRDGIEYGMKRPIYEAKVIEKSVEWTIIDGKYDFLASDEEMDEYEQAWINGTLEMGLNTYTELDNYWMFKKNHLVWFMGVDNTGKSLMVWYLAVLSALFHKWRVVIYSAENHDGQVRKKLKELFIGKRIKQMNAIEKEYADSFIEEHFRIFTSKGLYTWEELLMRAEVLFDEGWEFNVFIAEPYNSLDIPVGMDSHRHNLKSLNLLRGFKENYCSVWVADHANSEAGRKRLENGDVERPYKSSVDGGQLKPNKVDDYLVIHRNISNPARKMETEIYVDKIKDTETGGAITPKDLPVIFRANADLCGFECVGVDPVKKYWQRMKNPKQLEL